nr:hypothetical protein [uncultured Rhodopila sp.]
MLAQARTNLSDFIKNLNRMLITVAGVSVFRSSLHLSEQRVAYEQSFAAANPVRHHLGEWRWIFLQRTILFGMLLNTGCPGHGSARVYCPTSTIRVFQAKSQRV